jgi:hypothetical protein
MEAATLSGPGTWDLRLRDGSLRLSAGSHESPREGICAMELSSLLADEKFSDRPKCVCRVVAAFMRSLNDRASHADRQRLIPYASRVLGTSHGPTRLRRDICLAAVGANIQGGALSRLAARLAVRVRIWVLVGFREALRIDEGLGVLAARMTFARDGSDRAYEVLDRLIDAGAELETAPLADPVERAAKARVAATVGQLVRDTQISQQHHGGQGANGNGHSGHLRRGDPREGDKEDVERDHAERGDPERGAETSEDHGLARVP